MRRLNTEFVDEPGRQNNYSGRADCTAYIDMEFAGIYVTHQAMQIPVEVGVVVHQPRWMRSRSLEERSAGRSMSSSGKCHQ